MSKNHKPRKANIHTHHNEHNLKGRSTLLTRHPKSFFALGIILLIISGCLLSIGYLSNAKSGLSMLSFFFGAGLVFFSNSAMPKNKLKRQR